MVRLRLKVAFVDVDMSPRTGSRRFTCEVASQLQVMGHEIGIFTSRLDTQRCFRQCLSLPVDVASSRSSSQEGSASVLTRAIRKFGKNAIINLANNYGYDMIETDFALKTSEKIVSMGYEAVLFQYHGEHWLFPVFYHLNEAKGAVYLNMVPPRPRTEALPFQESTLERRIVDRLVSLPFVRRFEKASLRNVGLFITPSEYQLQQARVQGVIGQKKVAVVPLGVDHSEFYPTGEEEPFALYVGRIHPHKSIELAMMSMKNMNSDYSLVIAGDVDEGNIQYVERLLSLAEELKISDRFELILHPSERQIVRLMQSCSVFLFPSTIDTFGLVVLEAMACGKPVVACNRGGVPEIVVDAGFLIEPDVAQWEKAVTRMLSDSEFRHAMGQKALQRSAAYSWKHTTCRLLEALDTNCA
jgi:glycosyltransferase involved in cell wall biosynthesis